MNMSIERQRIANILLRVTGSSLDPSRPCWRRSHFRQATRRAEGIDSVSFLKIISLV